MKLKDREKRNIYNMHIAQFKYFVLYKTPYKIFTIIMIFFFLSNPNHSTDDVYLEGRKRTSPIHKIMWEGGCRGKTDRHRYHGGKEKGESDMEILSLISLGYILSDHTISPWLKNGNECTSGLL